MGPVSWTLFLRVPTIMSHLPPLPAVEPSATMDPSLVPGHAEAMQWLRSGVKKALVGGAWMEAVSGETFETIDPATEAVLTRVASCDVPDVDLAVKAARSAFESPTWSGISPHARARYLLRIADAIDSHADELAVIETLDTGVPVVASRARLEGIADIFRYYAGWCSKMYGTTNPTDASRFIYMLREPMGVCGLITAWNVPLVMAAVKIAPALACGNTVVLKPAELAPLSTLRLAELIEGIGLPAGVLNVVPGFGVRAGAAMSAHMGIDKISFTGSTAVGKQLLAASASNLKRLTLELGGKSPNIVFPDADLEQAIAAAVATLCRNSGQICASGSRLFVHESVHDQVLEAVCRKAQMAKVGLPFERDTVLGPLISARQRERVLSYVASGLSQGARLEVGGQAVGERGFFVQPTVFSGVSNGMRIAQEEIFGPVLSVIRFKDEHDAVFQANDTVYGLAAAVWTQDISRAHRVARALQAGRVWINTYSDGDPVMSRGGYRQSGFGREHGAESIDEFTQTKSVYLRL